MSRNQPFLPGDRRRRKAPPAAEPVHNAARRSKEALRQAVLSALAAGPLMKWQLREALHEPEVHVYRALQALRADKLVKVVGRNLDKRAWALTAYEAPKPTIGDHDTTVITSRKAAPPKDSWWAPFASDPDRHHFTAAQAARDAEAGWTQRRHSRHTEGLS